MVKFMYLQLSASIDWYRDDVIINPRIDVFMMYLALVAKYTGVSVSKFFVFVWITRPLG